MTDCYALMAAERGNYTVALMAKVLGVSASGFYSWLKRPDADAAFEELKARVEAEWLDSDRVFGARKIHSRLEGATLYGVRKAMRDLGIRSVVPNAKKRTTIADENAESRPDLVRRDFTAPVPTYKLVGDITYLRTGEGWLYLAVVIDLCTRMVVGWAAARRMKAVLAVRALEMAKRNGYVAEGAIFHSDRGSQYTSRLLADWAEANCVRLSVGRTGCCRDNAVAESFFASLKNEMYYRRKAWRTREEARMAVLSYIEVTYNWRRPHATIDYRFPAQVMREFFDRTAAKSEALDREEKKAA